MSQQRPWRWWGIALGCVLLATNGCSPDLPSAPAPTTRRQESSAAARSDTGEVTLTHEGWRTRFDSVTVQVAGVARPGRPLTVRVRGRALARTSDATVTLYLPDSRQAPAEGPRPVDSTHLWRGALDRNGRINVSGTVTFARPGLYRVIAVVRGPDGLESPSGAADDGPSPRQNTLLAETWVSVDEPRAASAIAGRPAPETGRSQGGVRRNPGPGDESVQPMVIPCEGPDCSGGTSGPLRGTVYYFDDVTGAWSPQPRARVTYGQYVTTTNDAGQFTITACPAPGGTGTVVAYSTGAEINQTWNGGTEIARAYVDNSNCAYPAEVYAVNTSAALLYANMVKAAIGTRSTFGANFSRTTPLRVTVASQSGTPRYWQSGDYVSSSADWVPGVEGRVNAAHEYGHSVHHTRIGGIQGYNAGNCPGFHTIYTVSTLGCAWIEGYATFHAVAVLGSQAGYWQTQVERDVAWNGSGVDKDGSQTEGSVAAYLYDLIDPTGPDAVESSYSFTDGVQIPAAYVLSVMRDCRIRTSSSFTGADRRVDGVDYLIYCLERASDVSVGPGTWRDQCFFTPVPGSTGGFTGGTQGANWNVQCIRLLSGQQVIIKPRVDARARDYYFLGRKPEYPISWSAGLGNFFDGAAWPFLVSSVNAWVVPEQRLWRCDLFGECSLASRFLAGYGIDYAATAYESTIPSGG